MYSRLLSRPSRRKAIPFERLGCRGCRWYGLGLRPVPRGQPADRRHRRPGHGDDVQRRTPLGLHQRLGGRGQPAVAKGGGFPWSCGVCGNTRSGAQGGLKRSDGSLFDMTDSELLHPLTIARKASRPTRPERQVDGLSGTRRCVTRGLMNCQPWTEAASYSRHCYEPLSVACLAFSMLSITACAKRPSCKQVSTSDVSTPAARAMVEARLSFGPSSIP